MITVAILFALSMLYDGFHAYMASRLWSQLLQRHRSTFIYSVVFAIGQLILLAVGAYNMYNRDGVEILMCVFLMNIYVYILAYFYTPVKAVVQEARRYDENVRRSETLRNNYEALGMLTNDNFFNNEYPPLADDAQRQSTAHESNLTKPKTSEEKPLSSTAPGKQTKKLQEVGEKPQVDMRAADDDDPFAI